MFSLVDISTIAPLGWQGSSDNRRVFNIIPSRLHTMKRYLAPLLTLATLLPIEGGLAQRVTVCPDYTTCITRGQGLINLDPALAMAHFQQALRLDPSDPKALAYLHILEAYLYGENGYCSTFQRCMSAGYKAAKEEKYQTALTHFKRALVFNPRNPEVHRAIFTVSRAVQQVANP